MLSDLQNLENVRLMDRIIDNKYMRFLYYRCNHFTNGFQKCHFLKKLFYPWFTLLRTHYDESGENYILFLNSGFCRELDITVVERLKKKNKKLKLVLYIVDPMVGFSAPEHMEIIKKMDLVYSINKSDCEKYGFQYYPLVYSREQHKEGEESSAIQGEPETDLYYLGSGVDRTEVLNQIYQKCSLEGIKTDFHVLGREQKQAEAAVTFHKSAISYSKNIELLKRTNCILEIMHEDFDNPTQRYSEAIVYNKKLLTNNRKTVTFDFYDPKYMQVFQSVNEIDTDFIKSRENVDYGYREEFSPIFLIREIANMPEG